METAAAGMSTLLVTLLDGTVYSAAMVMLTRGEANQLMLTFVANRRTEVVDVRRVLKVELVR